MGNLNAISCNLWMEIPGICGWGCGLLQLLNLSLNSHAVDKRSERPDPTNRLLRICHGVPIVIGIWPMCYLIFIPQWNRKLWLPTYRLESNIDNSIQAALYIPRVPILVIERKRKISLMSLVLTLSCLCFRALIHWEKSHLNPEQRRKEEARLVLWREERRRSPMRIRGYFLFLHFLAQKLLRI